MSSGGVFKLIANDGKADRMIMASELLSERIREIMCQRGKMGFRDPTPTLVDIERTHVLFVNAHFKPFVAIGYEYSKARTTSGNAQFGGTVTISIPQVGDFFHDMVANVTLAPVSATVGTVPAFPQHIGNVDQVTTATQRVSAVNDPVTGVYTRYTMEYVNLAGNVLAVGSPASNFVQYCEWPGHRLFRKTKFEVNGNPLDEYTSDAYVFFEKFRMPTNKLPGWRRLMGQEAPQRAQSDLLQIAGSSNWSVVDLQDVTGNPVNGSIRTATNTCRQVVQLLDGPQTPKATQPALDLWIPLLFWFNLDSRLSVPSVALPFGQRFLTFDIEQQSNIVFTAPGNLFLRLRTERITSTGVGQGTAAAVGIVSTQTSVNLTPVLAQNSVVDPTQQISQFELYINNIFVKPEIHDIYIKRIGFSLIRIHRNQTNRINVESGEILLAQLKFPTEFFFVGFRPSFNISNQNVNQPRDWHRFTALEDHVVDKSAQSTGLVSTDPAAPIAAAQQFASQHSTGRLTYTTSTPTIDRLKIEAHGISIYDDFKANFYDTYLPYHFGGVRINTPRELGAYFVNFCLHPGEYQPSGHVNVSRAREFYIKWNSSYISSTNTVDMIIISSAINFLLISDGNAVLRYST